MRALTTTFLATLAAALPAQNPQNPPPAPGGQQPYSSSTPIQQPANPPAGDPAQPPPAAPPREPVRESGRESHGTDVRIDIAFGGGNFEHQTDGQPLLSDDTDAGYFRLGLEVITECGFGGGLRLEGVGTDDDLFQQSGGSPCEAADGELLLHATWRLRTDRLEMPIRGGLFVRGYGFEENSTGDRIDWLGAGLKLEVEPDFALVQGDSARWSLYGRLAVAAGGATVTDDPDVIGDADTTMHAFDVALGTRIAFRHVDVGIGWLLRTATWEESDPVGSVVYRAIDTRFSGIELSLAARF